MRTGVSDDGAKVSAHFPVVLAPAACNHLKGFRKVISVKAEGVKLRVVESVVLE